jgi:hypothetical protein
MFSNKRIETFKMLATEDIMGMKILNADQFAKLIIEESAEIVAGYVNERTFFYAGITIRDHFGLRD